MVQITLSLDQLTKMIIMSYRQGLAARRDGEEDEWDVQVALQAMLDQAQIAEATPKSWGNAGARKRFWLWSVSCNT